MTGIRVVAQQYIDNGWNVVPLNPGEKAASVAWARRPREEAADSTRERVSDGLPSAGIRNEPAANFVLSASKPSSAAQIFKSFNLKRSVASVGSALAFNT